MKQCYRVFYFVFALLSPLLLHAQYATKVFDFLPAPGQFTNTSIGVSSASTNVVGNTSSMVSLGSFGGYLIVGFDRPIVNNPQNPYGVDFSIEGNSFGGNLYGQWCEPGAVQVMKDLNHNGIPDDGDWYELAGSDYWLSTTSRNVTMTYYNPHYSKGHAVTWKCNNGGYGAMVSNRFHTQPYYPDPFDFGTAIMDSVSFTGNRIRGTIDMSSPSYLNPYRAPIFGYCDSKGNNSPLTTPQNPYSSGTDGFDLSWAVDKQGNYVDLDTVNFVKIYNAGFANIGWLGEWSTEVLNVAITTPDATYVPQDYYRNYIGITQLQILKGHTCKYDGILFKNGRPQTDGTSRWWTSNPNVATVDNEGNLTGIERGETWLYFSQKSDIKPDSAFVKIVELTGVVLEMEGNNPNISSDTTSLLVGEKIFIIGECTDTRTNVLNSTVANRFVYEPLVWTTSNSAIGTIDNGLFAGIAPGITHVYARSTSNPTLCDSIKVIVHACPEVKSITDYIKIPSFMPTGSYAASDLFTTGTNSEVILNSAVAKHGNMNVSIAKNEFNYSFTSGVYTSDTVRFSITAFGQNRDFGIAFDYNPEVKANAKQLVFTYTGTDGTKALKSGYPDSDEIKTITELTDETVVDMQVDGAYLYVVTDKRLLRYNLSTYRAENILSLDYAARKLIVYENRLYVSGTQNGVPKLFAYFKSDLSSITTITLPAEATALVATNSKLYALLNSASSSALAVITADVNTVSFEKTVDWGSDGLNASELLVKDAMLYAVRKKSASTTSAVISYNTTTDARIVTETPTVEYQSTNSSAEIEQMTGDSILLKNKRGFTPFNTQTLALGATTYMRDNSRYPSGAAYDNIEKKYYVTHVSSTDSKGSVFASTFTIDKNFTNIGVAPTLVRFSPALVTNEKPAVKAAIGDQVLVENKTKLIVTVNKANSFSDTENNFNIYPKTIDSLFSWKRNGVNLIYTAYFNGTVVADSVITAKVEAIDNYGCSVTNTFNITIKPRIYAPYTSTVITDRQVAVNSPALKLSLKDVFEFFSANVDVQNMKTVTGNSNPALVTATVDQAKDSLILSFAKDQLGEALITLRGATVETELDEGEVAHSKYIEFTFKVTVVDNEITGLSPVSTTQMQVYPTLTSGKITIVLTQEESISVYNISGIKVESIEGKQGLNEIDLSAYPNGLYFVKAESKAVKVVLCK